VEETLKKFKNVTLISHDRGIQYVNVSNKYIHVLDRFHLLKNLFEKIKHLIDTSVPVKYTIKQKVLTFQPEITLSKKQEEKLKLIKVIRKQIKKGISARKLADLYNLDRKTIKIYVDLNQNNLIQYVQFKRISQSMYNREHDTIQKLYNSGYTSTSIFQTIEENNPRYKLASLRCYIKHHMGTESRRKREYTINKKSISRYKIFKDVVGFNMNLNRNELEALKSFYRLNPDFSIIKKFYNTFKNALTSLNTSVIKSIIKKTSSVTLINTYNRSLNKNYNGVVNAARYKENNGIVEGVVRRIKSIKTEMFGKASFNLLRNKLIYRSLFF
jgi:transposase